jgi:translocation and assembly module TamB
LDAPPLASRLTGEFSVTTSTGAWSADVTLDESVIEGATLAAGTVGHVESVGRTLRYSGIGHLTGLDLQRLAGPLDLPMLAQDRYDSRLTGSFYIGGRGRDADRFIVGGATLSGSEIAGAALPIMSASLTLAGQTLAVDANGTFEHLPGRTLGLAPDVAADLTGVVNAMFLIPDLEAPTTIETIDGRGQVVISDSVVQGVQITRALVDGELVDGLLALNDLTVTGPAGDARASGTLALGTTGESSLVLRSDLPDLAVLGSHVGRPLAGSARLEATITGPANSLLASGTLAASELAYGESVSALTMNSTFTARVDERRFRDVDVDAETSATFVKLGDAEILRLAATTAYQSQLLDLTLQVEDQARTLTLQGDVAFQPDAREIQFRTLGVTAGTTTWQLAGTSPARVRYGTDIVTVEGLSLAGASGRVDIAGSLALDADAENGPLTLTLTDVAVSDVNQLMLGTRRLGGLINGTVVVAGSTDDPNVRADLNVTQGSVEGVAYESLAGTVTYRNGQAVLDVTLTQTPANQLTAKGTVPVARSETAGADGMNVRVQSSGVALALAQLFTGELSNVTGATELDVTATGALRAPVLNGMLAVTGGGFTVVATGVAYRDFNARLRLENSRLQIDELHIADSDGHPLTATGGVDVFAGATGRAVDVRIVSDGIHVLNNELGDIALDVDLFARGTLTAPRIEGTLRVADGSLEVGQILEITTSEGYKPLPADEPARSADPAAGDPATRPPTDAPAPPARPSPRGIFDQAELDLTVRLPDNVVLRGRDMRVGTAAVGVGDMNIITGGEFAITKRPGGEVELLGQLEIVRGSYTFQGRRFEVERGSTVSFRGLRPLNPTLGVSAAREISGVTALVSITGTAREPRLELTSRPPLDESDILSLIVFNRPVNDLGGSERLTLGERAGALAAGAIAAPIADSVARALNLDVVEIQPTAVGDQAPSLAVGSQIGSRIYVGVKQEFGQGDVSTVSLEYRISRLLRLVTSLAYSAVQTQAARRTSGSGVDLIFVVRY